MARNRRKPVGWPVAPAGVANVANVDEEEEEEEEEDSSRILGSVVSILRWLN